MYLVFAWFYKFIFTQTLFMKCLENFAKAAT